MREKNYSKIHVDLRVWTTCKFYNDDIVPPFFYRDKNYMTKIISNPII